MSYDSQCSFLLDFALLRLEPGGNDGWILYRKNVTFFFDNEWRAVLRARS